ncbi:MAG: NAD-dependent epimerase/dehydratase family protein, partial [Chitinivibrionales bacterium]|nr:NAD-dependent epimerase/dehydratase family protein [Chitinivibrionales bacterium]MBD3356682.1 NAD-dependent epimerase/dehydratase family protein [Chitinivibrionales bacterium]
AMVTNGVRNIVFSSSCATYGIPQAIPIRETQPQIPISPYGNTKLTGERSIKDYAVGHGMRYALLRYFNAAGADPDGEAWEHHDPETHLIPLAIRATCGGEHLKILGDDYPTDDGTCVRDYVHVCDLADAHVQAVRRLIGGGDSFACNLGAGTGVSVRQVIDMVEEVTGTMVAYEIGQRRIGDPPEAVAASDVAREILDWTPIRSNLRRIVEDAVRVAARTGYGVGERLSANDRRY